MHEYVNEQLTYQTELDAAYKKAFDNFDKIQETLEKMPLWENEDFLIFFTKSTSTNSLYVKMVNNEKNKEITLRFSDHIKKY